MSVNDPTIAVALWNARSMVSELATKRWPKTNATRALSCPTRHRRRVCTPTCARSRLRASERTTREGPAQWVGPSLVRSVGCSGSLGDGPRVGVFPESANVGLSEFLELRPLAIADRLGFASRDPTLQAACLLRHFTHGSHLHLLLEHINFTCGSREVPHPDAPPSSPTPAPHGGAPSAHAHPT